MSNTSLRTTTRWAPGEPIVRREVWKGSAWMGMAAIVVEDLPTHLAIFVPTDAPFAYADGDWPTDDGLHPWQRSKTRWTGHGCLMLQAPGDPYSIWHFWEGLERTFAGWYINLQDAFRRSGRAMDTLDHEVDVVVNVDGSAELKDVDRVADCVRMGRFDAAFGEVVATRGRELVDRLNGPEGIWWDRGWDDWQPPAEWSAPVQLPEGWDE